MKTSIRLLAMLLGLTARAWGDGMIVIHEPGPVPHGHYAFAPLEVVYHHVTVAIDRQIATTTVDQEFYNPNPQRLEGTYLFPVPKGAQIDKFTMEIGGQKVEAELLPADKARRIYEDIVRKLRDPALLEYAGRDTFKVRVFPIEPRGNKRISLSYSEVLKSDAGLVSYTYPLNTEKFSAQPVKSVSIKIEIDARRPLKSIYSPSHNVEIRRHGTDHATVGFEAKDVKPDTDFQLFFAPENQDLGVNLMTFRQAGEDGYFLMLASPGAELKNQPTLPKDVAFVLDTSGSMAGPKLAQAKKALQFCVDNLNDQDRFEILRFSTETEPLFDKLADATADHRKRAFDFIKDLHATGGTALEEALLKALALRPAKSSRPYVVIFLTDGQPTVGDTDENSIVAAVAKSSGATRVFCFGIGTDVNTHLLDRITETTRAVSQYVLPEEDIEVKVSNFFTKIKEPVLSEVKLKFTGDARVTKLYPTALPDLFRGDQLVIVGRYSGHGHGAAVIEGSVNGAAKSVAWDVEFHERASDHEFIPRLWATRRIGYLLDEVRLHGENAELRDEITELARKYGIVTPYTAYLIVEDESRRNVPVALRSMQELTKDRAAREQTANAWDGFQRDRSGVAGVGGAVTMGKLKSLSGTAQTAGEARFAAQRALEAAAPAGAADAVQRIAQYTQQTRFVQGRTFFQNGNQWIDTGAQKLSKAQHVQLQFNSDKYFELVTQHPEALAWLALGRNVTFTLDDTVYEITE